MLLLNIGLKTSTKNFDNAVFNKGVLISAQYVLHHVEEMLGVDNLVWYKVKESNTEDTLILAMDLPFMDLPFRDTIKVVIRDIIRDLADATQQDCIAVYDCSSGTGELLGTYAHEWGTFNPEYFLI